MTDLVRPNFGEAWASEGERVAPDASKIKLGWVQEMMPFQYENFLQARQDDAILYLMQKGVSEYNEAQEYIANKSVVQYQGNLYLATATVTGVVPTTTASWKRLSPALASNGAVSVAGGGTGATTAAGARANLGLGSASTANLPSSNGVVVKSADDTLISRTLTGTSGNISITNPDGVAGNININVGTNVAQLDKDSSWTSKGGITLPKGSSGDRGVEVAGKIRYNTELQKFEGFDGTSWNALGAASEVEITTLSGDGVTTSFTLNVPVFSEPSTDVYIGGVYQNKGTYSVSGTTLTFSEAPTPGTDNIQVVSRRVVDLGITRASQVSIEDTTNKYTATTVEGALREITEYEGEIEGEASWDNVPKHKSAAFNAQAQALVNRIELVNRLKAGTLLVFADMEKAQDSVLSYRDGQLVAVEETNTLYRTTEGALTKVLEYSSIDESASRIQIASGVQTVKDPTIKAYGDIEVSGEDLVSVPVSTVSAVNSGSDTFTITVSNSDVFIVGRFVFLWGQARAYRGLYKVIGKSVNSLTLEGYHAGMAVEAVTLNAKPLNTVLKLESGSSAFTVVGSLKKLSNIVIDASDTTHGLIAGSPLVTGQRKSAGEIVEAHFVGVYGGSTVGIAASTCGVIGVNKIAATKSKIGIIAFHGGVIVGNGAYAHWCSDDNFKSESCSTFYVHDFTVTRAAGVGVASRYSSFMELDQGYICDVQLSQTLAQFNSYLSLRGSVTEGPALYSLYATGGGHIVTNGNTLSGSTVNGVRAIKRSRVESVGANTSISIASGTERHIENSDVSYNGVTYSGRVVERTYTGGSIVAGGRAATTVSVTGLTKEVPVHVSINTDLPPGVIFQYAQTTEGIVRLFFQNVSPSAVTLGDVQYVLSY